MYASRKKHSFSDTAIQYTKHCLAGRVFVPVLYNFLTLLKPVTSYLGQLSLAVPLRVGAVTPYRVTYELTPRITFSTYSRLKIFFKQKSLCTAASVRDDLVIVNE